MFIQWKTYLGQFLYSWWSPSWSECGLQFLCSLRATAEKQYKYVSLYYNCSTGKLFPIFINQKGQSQDKIGWNLLLFFLWLLLPWSTFAATVVRACNFVSSNITIWNFDNTAHVIYTQRDEVVVRCWLPAADDCAQVISCRHPWKRYKKVKTKISFTT